MANWTSCLVRRSTRLARTSDTDYLKIVAPWRGHAALAQQGRHVGGSSGISRVALDTMRSIFQELPRMTPEAARGPAIW